ncbi:hypothetical protein ACFWFU_05845 [Streptomyces sp. NPDC060235]|uniref:hypothetical protein n=1 Tax=Streptomyces sp. NPDC060235 TaxID=3347080 RepID=UPI00365B3CDD
MSTEPRSEDVVTGEGVTLAQLLVTEYQTIKDEQKARIGFRDNLLYVTLAAVVAVVAAATQAKQPQMLLALPPVCVVLGWTYLVNDEKISAIGAYVRSELGPSLAAATGIPGATIPVFGWETAHRSDPKRRSRKRIQCLVDQGTFCLVPAASLAVYWAHGSLGALMISLSAIEALTVAVLAVEFALYAKAPRTGT